MVYIKISQYCGLIQKQLDDEQTSFCVTGGNSVTFIDLFFQLQSRRHFRGDACSSDTHFDVLFHGKTMSASDYCALPTAALFNLFFFFNIFIGV